MGNTDNTKENEENNEKELIRITAKTGDYAGVEILCKVEEDDVDWVRVGKLKMWKGK